RTQGAPYAPRQSPTRNISDLSRSERRFVFIHVHSRLKTFSMISPAFPVDAPAALASQPRGEADGEQDRFGQRVQQDGQPGMSETYNEHGANGERARDG